MRFGERFAINWMARDNESLWLWFDVQIGSRWYVLIWRKQSWPYCYWSRDATPPDNGGEGAWLFGRYHGYRD